MPVDSQTRAAKSDRPSSLVRRMHILALNCGSSSIKCVLIDTATRERLLEMHIDNLGSAHCRLTIGDERLPLDAGTDAQAGVRRLIAELQTRLFRRIFG